MKNKIEPRYTIENVQGISITTCGDSNEITRFFLHTPDGDVLIDAISIRAEERSNVIKFERAKK